MTDTCAFFCSAIEILEKWQTLVTGIIALGAAWWTIRVIKEQIALQKAEINSNEERHRDSLKSKLFSIRAHMPDALSELSGYARNCMLYLRDLQDSLPDRPFDSINTMKNSIEYVDGDTAASIFEMVTHYQVHNSRILSYSRDRRAYDFVEKFYDTTLLHAYIDKIFEYSRGESEGVTPGSPSKKDMISSLRQAVGLAEFLENEEDFRNCSISSIEGIGSEQSLKRIL
jgi:hypothetical protein